MKAFWEKFKSLRIWAILGAFFAMVGGWFVIAAKAIGRAAVCVGRWFAAVGRVVFGALKVFGRWCLLHRRLVAVNAAIVAVAIGIFLSLYLTLPVKSVEIEGEVLLLEGEEYASGLNIKATTKAGLIHREEVLPSMISGLDPAVPGVQEVTVSYKRWRVSAQVTVLGLSDVTLRVREGSLPTEFEPNDPFPTSGIFDLYYNGERIRSAPIVRASVPGFTTKLSRDYDTTLVYRKGLSLPYHYTVLERIDSITFSGVLYAPQGVALSKGNTVGNLRFLVKYKDGTEEYVMIYDESIFVQEKALESRDEDYVDAVTFLYKGVEVVCPVTAYHGDLLAPKSVTLNLGRSVYAEGETFDYSSAYLSVVYERFGDAPVLLHAAQDSILLATYVESGESDSGYYLPLTDGTEPLVFDEVGYYTLLAYTNLKYSLPVRVRVVSSEDASRVTDLTTTWRGRQSGPPVKGQDLDFTDATLTLVYGFGYAEEDIPLTSDMVTGYDKEVVGDQTLTMTYSEIHRDLVIRVGDPDSDEVTAILSVIGWDESTYYDSPALVVPEHAYLEVEVGYGAAPNGKVYLKEHLELDEPDVKITGFTPQELARQELRIEYKDFSIIQPLEVKDNRTKTIIEFSAPHDIWINVGDALDISGDCIVFYSTGDDLTLSLAKVLEAGGTMEGSYDANTPGDYPVRFYYPGFDSSEHFTWIHVEGSAPATPKDIRLDISKAKTTYKVGDTLDIKNMTLYLVYSNGYEEEIEDYLREEVFTGFSTAPEMADGLPHTATVTYFSGDFNRAKAYEYWVVE